MVQLLRPGPEYRSSLLDFRLEAKPVAMLQAVVGGQEAQAQVVAVGAIVDAPVCRWSLTLGTDAFGGLLLERQTGFNPGQRSAKQEVGTVLLTISIEDEASLLQAQGLVDVVLACQVVEEVGQEVFVRQDEVAGQVLLGGGVVEGIEQARQSAGGLQFAGSNLVGSQHFVRGQGGIGETQLCGSVAHLGAR